MDNTLQIPVIEQYVSRKINGIKDLELFDQLGNSTELGHVNILLKGPTGTAKTSVARQYAAINNLHYVRMSCTVAASPDAFFGKFIPNPDQNSQNKFVWHDGPVTQIVRNGGVLVLDEINFLTDKIGASLFSLLDKERTLILVDKDGELIKAHPDLRIFATMNPGYRGTKELNKALENRFAVSIEWDYDPKVEKQLVTSHSLLLAAKNIRKEIQKSGSNTPLPTNALMDFENFTRTINIDFAINVLSTKFSTEPELAQEIKNVLDTNKEKISREIGPTTILNKKIVKEKTESPYLNLWGVTTRNGDDA